MKLMAWSAVILQMMAGLSDAQTHNELEIRVGAYSVSADGGEKPAGVWWTTGLMSIGKPLTSTFSLGASCGAFTVSSTGELRDDATTAWKVEVTPLRVVKEAVTFRLRWVRFAAPRSQVDVPSFGQAKSAGGTNDDVEVTLRPGQSLPVDSVRMPAGAKTVDGRVCGPTASIRVSVDTTPWEDEERRLIAAELWLVERLANGTDAQRSQPLNVRSLPNRPVRFYFDSIVDGNVSLDIFGSLVARPGSDAMTVSVETRSRWEEASASHRSAGPQRSVTSVVEVKPAETVEIRLPPFGEGAGPFANRSLSIRIRTRQLR